MINLIQEYLHKREFKPVKHGQSEQKLVVIDFPEGWFYKKSKITYNFCAFNKLQGVLQISVYVNNLKNFDGFDPREELIEIKKTHITATIVNYENHQAIHYALNPVENKLIEYHWISGNARTKVFITYIHSIDLSEKEKDLEYYEAVRVIEGIRILS
ncbi:MAG: hypothetical protein KDC09_10420 [Bacteroidales bacterium]|nr:hypothetical protein [Bacteroidales bacterium]